jgi:antirestriction protein
MSGITNETRENRPRVYVASLADYVAGRLHGRWIDVDQPANAIRDEIAQMLAESKEPIAEEWAIHDYENFEGLSLSEFEDIDKVAEVAFLITEHGPVFASLVSYLGGTSSIDEARRYMEDGYRGAFDSLEDYAQELIEECYRDVLKGLPDFIRYHIDFDGIAHDMELSGDVFTLKYNGKTHVFDAHI